MDFDGLVDRYEKPIFNLVYRLLGDWDEAADVTQETFVSAYKSFGQFRGESSEYTWLYRIAINRCKNRFRYNDKRKNCEEPATDDSIEDRLHAGDAARPDTAFERKELKEYIERAIMQLDYDYRIVAVLRDLHGLSYSEVAEATGLSIDVVRTRLSRARAMLRKKLQAYLSG